MSVVPAPLQHTGITYRQLDYWSRRGYIKPLQDGGSGAFRWWPDIELAVADLIHRLIGGGLTVEAAAVAARHAVENNADTVALPNGLTLHISPEAAA